MKIHYISDHAVLEYDEVQLLTDLGYEVFSNGAYLDPKGHFSLPRPALVGAKEYPEYAKIARETPRTQLPAELIEPFDVIIIMHAPQVLFQNWERIKHKKVIWRSIGQSVPRTERKLQELVKQGLKIVRYSPKEKNLSSYAGEAATIRFYKDPEVYKGWNGETKDIVNFTQTLKGRRDFCHYDEIFATIRACGGMVYGTGNEDLGEFNGGNLPYNQQLRMMRRARALIYGGTWPAPYTLSFIEALMTGLPIVSISKKIAHVEKFEPIDFFEVDEILAKIGGIVCDTAEEMIKESKRLQEDLNHAKNISEKQRKIALELFGKERIGKQWGQIINE